MLTATESLASSTASPAQAFYTSRIDSSFHVPGRGLPMSALRGSFRRRASFSPGFVCLDVILLALLYFDISWLKPSATFSLPTLALMALAQIVATTAVGGYSLKTQVLSLRYACEHFLGAAFAFMGTVLVVYFVFPEYFIASRATVLITMSLAPLLQLLVRRASQAYGRSLEHEDSLLVLSPHCDEDLLDSHLRDHAGGQRTYFVSPQSGKVVSSNQIVNRLENRSLTAAIALLGTNLKAVVIAMRPESLPTMIQNTLLAANFKMVPVYTLEAYYAREFMSVPLSTLSAPWGFDEGFRLAQSVTYSRIKRMLDVWVAVAAIVGTGPLMLLCALLVRLDSPGPALFRQTRVGQYEEPFTMFKFRTMRLGSENGPRYTGEKDPRITPIGNFLRKTRLDELPQLFNVLKGDMSIIGPRAEWDQLVLQYQEQIPYYHLRHLVRPGITGWAQVNYPYGANLEDTRQKLSYDLYYVRYYSFMLDLRITLKTAFVMLFGKGR